MVAFLIEITHKFLWGCLSRPNCQQGRSGRELTRTSYTGKICCSQAGLTLVSSEDNYVGTQEGTVLTLARHFFNTTTFWDHLSALVCQVVSVVLGNKQ